MPNEADADPKSPGQAPAPSLDEPTALPSFVSSLPHAGQTLESKPLLPPIESVYLELRRLACSYLRGERSQQSLQPTALVHEAYLRLAGRPNNGEPWWRQSSDFIGICARVMRQVLVDHARKRNALKRARPSLESSVEADGVADSSSSSTLRDAPTFDVLELDEQLRRFEGFSPRGAEVVHLRFFLGLTVPQTAEALDISVSTVESDWRAARAWLVARIKGGEACLRISPGPRAPDL